MSKEEASDKTSVEGNVPGMQLNRTLTDLNINSEKQTEASSKDAPAEFETAMNVAGFGTFNILLLICALPAAMATVLETSVISYILPSAECDLKLSLIDKGLLNGITYVGMITSAILWGYVADTKGRKKLLISGYLTNIISILGAACSQNVIQLMVFKFISGFIMCGPFAVLMSYLSELHGKKYRSRIVMLLGLMFSLGNILLPVVALGVLPSHWDFQILGLQFHSWQIFLALSTIPCLLGGALLSFFPESPKFLMSQGRNAEALRIFQRIYAMNNRKPREDYPIKELINEQSSSEKTSDDASTVSIATIEESIPKEKETVKPKLPIKEKKPKLSLRQGLQQLRPLLRKPYLGLSLQVYLINFAILLGQNTLRLWMPQMFASIEEYEQRHGTEDATMCTILEYSVNKTQSQITQSAINKCEVIITAASYTNNITVAITSCVGYLLAGFVINRIGSKMLLAICSIIAGLCAIGLYFSISALSTLIIISISVSVGSISAMSVISSSVDLFPTSLRTMIVSLAMMFGRIGSILGNILFPIFMSLGCIPPFIMLAFVMFSAGIMSAFLPSTRKTVLK
ncbi:synaptic vesicle glycoprotein 2B-like isoform X2 [Anastrepha ludens]|uniref:synaptic vesicle glycoprotein 2B-like isoform X2 n=1 Tax=Anastrepha ludens TaxID=28586 RepID=UPI0023AF2D4E|nr:synaptic vesicle glycoprotein 2B-like isoform X2 [Anastrepha ludens]